MSRLILTAVALLLAASAGRAADLPIGKWSVAFEDKKGELVITEVGRDGKVKATLSGNAVEGTWDGETLTLKGGDSNLEACLVVEEVAKGGTKYTLAGFRWSRHVNFFLDPPAELTTRRGWYAQKIVKEADQIKAEVKGTLVCKGTPSAYISVKRDDGFGREVETPVYFRFNPAEWKHWQAILPKLDGQTVTVTGELAQFPLGNHNHDPEGGMYFRRGFVIKTATETFK